MSTDFEEEAGVPSFESYPSPLAQVGEDAKMRIDRTELLRPLGTATAASIFLPGSAKSVSAQWMPQGPLPDSIEMKSIWDVREGRGDISRGFGWGQVHRAGADSPYPEPLLRRKERIEDLTQQQADAFVGKNVRLKVTFED